MRAEIVHIRRKQLLELLGKFRHFGNEIFNSLFVVLLCCGGEMIIFTKRCISNDCRGFILLFVYPAENENEVFKIMLLFSITYSDVKEKATNDFNHLSHFLLQGVDFSYKLSNKFIEDFERIMDFVEYKHIAL